MSGPTDDKFKPGNDTTTAMIAFGVAGGVLTVGGFLMWPPPDYNLRRTPNLPTLAQVEKMSNYVLGAGLMSLGLTGILGGARRTMPYEEISISKYYLDQFSNPNRNLLKSRGEMGVGLGLVTGGILAIAQPSAEHLGWWGVPILLTVAGIAAVAVADDSLKVVKWS